MIQDVPIDVEDGASEYVYRVHSINNIPLGKDEKVFLTKELVSTVVKIQDPNFTRIRDVYMLDLVIDATVPPTPKSTQPDVNETVTPTPEILISEVSDDDPEADSNMILAFSSFLQHVTSILRDQPSSSSPPPSGYQRQYLPAITPTGVGAAPIPDVEETFGPSMDGSPVGTLLWHTIYMTDEACSGRLPSSSAESHQIIVMKRGGCNFDDKLANIPYFAPRSESLQLVVVVSFEEDEDDLPAWWLVRPLLERRQETGSGLARQNPVPMVMVGGGERVYEMFRGARGVGIKRRYSVQTRGVPISNVIII